MDFKLKFTSLLLCGVMLAGIAEGTEAGEKRKAKKNAKQTTVVADTTKQAPKGIPSIEKFIKADAKKHEGMFNIYEQGDRYFMEVPDQLLGRDILVFVSLIKGSAQLQRGNQDMYGFGGDGLYNKVIRFEKGGKDKLFLQEPIFTTRLPKPDAPMYGAIEASNMTPLAAGFDVKAKSDHSVLVDITDMYKSDHIYFSLKGSAETLKLGAYQADKSYPTEVSTYANNVIFRSVRSYAQGKAPKNNPKTKLNPTTWEVAASWFLLPEEPMKPRYFDNRVGFFAFSMMDYSKNPLKPEKIAVTSRWRLEPKPEDVEKYKRGELVEPAKPIVFYVDRNTPEYLQPYVIAAVNNWQPAFERVGFKNAIIGKLMPTPEEDPEFSPEDARYSIISYKASPMPNAYGPHVADPRSGEIICSHVGLFHNVLSLAQSWYFAQTAASNELARKLPYSEELVGELLEYIVTHEIGHTLGLRHNFASSWTYSLKDIRNKDYVKKNGHCASIMDYARFNYVAQPEDHIAPEDLIPRIGVYDEFAIEWGYRYFPQYKNAEEEQAYLKNWVTEQRKADPRLYFGTEIDKYDPRFQSEDLSDDIIKANTLGMKNLKIIMEHLEEWTATADDENYTVLKEMYNAVYGQYLRYMTHALKFVGGRYTNDAALRSEGMDRYIPVEKAKQQEAMDFLKKYLFTEQAWLFNCRVSQIASSNIDAVLNKISGKLMTQLTSVMPQLVKHEALLGDKTYTAKNFADDLYDGIWKCMDTKNKLSPYERMLQNNYIALFAILAKDGPLDVAPEYATFFIGELDKIASRAKKKAAVVTDPLTKNHLLGVAQSIQFILTGDKTAMLK